MDTMWVAKDPTRLQADSEDSYHLCGCAGSCESSVDAHAIMYKMVRPNSLSQKECNVLLSDKANKMLKVGSCYRLVVQIRFNIKLIR